MVDARHHACTFLFFLCIFKWIILVLVVDYKILLCHHSVCWYDRFPIGTNFCQQNFFIWVFSVVMQVFVLNQDKFGRSKKHEKYRISRLNFASLCLCHLYYFSSSFGHIAKRVVHLDGSAQTWLHWNPKPFRTQLFICRDGDLLYFSYSNLISVYISICMTNPCCR